ncbi:MAG TPA: site-2 protease family protein [Gemmatimonadales bacterium]|nr:site-2 protease family protein [Gemmatimonadales bacterium]
MPTLRCQTCGGEIAESLLACPACGALVHAAALKQLADDAAKARAAGDVSAALAAWRQALDLLPPGTRQREVVAATIDSLGRELEHTPPTPGSAPHSSGRSKAATGAAGVGALGLLLSKLKLVLLGLTKLGTLASMLLAFSVYWTLWGWRFALGFVVSIYIHEMGHVNALTRLGIKATAPMFIPGIGAVVRLKQYPVTPREDARVGLAGPIWGLAAAAIAYAVYRVTDNQTWGAIAQVAAWINLFNLLPVWQLDGARGFRALSRAERWGVVAIVAAMWLATHEGLLVLLFLTAAYAAWRGQAQAEGDRRAAFEFGALVVVLSVMTRIPVRTI